MQIAKQAQRLDWPDLAKALSILLVVLMHCSEGFARAAWADYDPLTSGWHTLNEAIKPIRMPLFFLVSGLLASRSLSTSKVTVRRDRVYRPLYLYVLWGVIITIVAPIGFSDDIPNNPLLRAGIAVGFVATSSWYMFALAVFFLITKASMRLPVLPVMLAAAAMSLFATFAHGMLTEYQPRLLRCLVFFMVGARMRDSVLAFARGASPARVCFLAAGYLAGAKFMYGTENFFLPVDMLAVAFGVTACQLIARSSTAAMRPARWLAQRTLPVYLVHFLVIPALVWGCGAWLSPDMRGSVWFVSVAPLLALPVLVGSSLGAHKILTALKAGWLFDLPAWTGRSEEDCN